MKEVNHPGKRKGELQNGADGGTFYKCPIGGFVSLRPGVCPKCGATLVPGDAATSERMERNRKG